MGNDAADLIQFGFGLNSTHRTHVIQIPNQVARDGHRKSPIRKAPGWGRKIEKRISTALAIQAIFGSDADATPPWSPDPGRSMPG